MRYTHQCAHCQGRLPRPGDVFCRRCYFALPATLRRSVGSWASAARTRTDALTMGALSDAVFLGCHHLRAVDNAKREAGLMIEGPRKRRRRGKRGRR